VEDSQEFIFLDQRTPCKAMHTDDLSVFVVLH